MNRRRHATLARLLIEACGGLAEAAEHCRIGKSQLADCQSPHGVAYLPADAMAALEAHCGQAIYSAAIAGALPDTQMAGCIRDEAAEAAEAAVDLSRDIRLAAADGVITPAERAVLTRRYERTRAELEQVGALLGREQAG